MLSAKQTPSSGRHIYCVKANYHHNIRPLKKSAAIHRFLMSDGAKGTSTAQYAGISEAYALQMQSVGLASAVQLPGTKRGYTISDLLDSSKEESSKKAQQK